MTPCFEKPHIHFSLIMSSPLFVHLCVHDSVAVLQSIDASVIMVTNTILYCFTALSCLVVCVGFVRVPSAFVVSCEFGCVGSSV